MSPAILQPAAISPATSPDRPPRTRKVSEKAKRFFRKNSLLDTPPTTPQAEVDEGSVLKQPAGEDATTKPSPITVPHPAASLPTIESPTNMHDPPTSMESTADTQHTVQGPVTTPSELARPSTGTPTTARQKSFFSPRRSSTAMTAPIGALPVVSSTFQSDTITAVDHSVPDAQRQRPALKVRIITWNHGNTIPRGDLDVLLGRVEPYVPLEPGWDISYDSESDGSEEDVEHDQVSPQEVARRDEARQQRRAMRGQWAAGQEKTPRADRIPPLPLNSEHPYHVIVIAGQECPWGDGKRIATGMGMAGELGDIALARSRSKSVAANKKEKVEKKPSVSRRGSQNDLKGAAGTSTPGTSWSNEFPFGQKASANGARTPNPDGATTPGIPGTPTTQHRHLVEDFGDRKDGGWAISGKGWSDICEDWLCRGAGSQVPASQAAESAPTDLKSAPSSSDLTRVSTSASAGGLKNKVAKTSKPDLHIDISAPIATRQAPKTPATPTPQSAPDSHLTVPGSTPHSASADSDQSAPSLSSSSPSNTEPNEWGVIRAAAPSPSIQHGKNSDAKHDATPKNLGPYELVVKERMLGCYMAVYVWRGCKDRVRGFSRDHVKSGLLAGRVGNKGGCGISLKLGETRLLFINAHLAAHEGRVAERLANVIKIKHELEVDNFLPEGDPRSLYEDVTERFDHCFWAGDLNFRVDISRKHADWLLLQKAYQQALEFDQLRSVLKEGIVFQGFNEAPINFPPTYKYDVLKTLKPRRAKTIRNRIIHVRTGSKSGGEAVAVVSVPAALVQDEPALNAKKSDLTQEAVEQPSTELSQAIRTAKRQQKQDNASITDEDTDESAWDAFTKGALESTRPTDGSDLASLDSDAGESPEKGRYKGFSQGAAVKAKTKFLEIMRAATATAIAGHKGKKSHAVDSDSDSITGKQPDHPLKRKLSSKPASSTPALPTVLSGVSSTRSSISADDGGDETVEAAAADTAEVIAQDAARIPKTVSGSVIRSKRRPPVRRRSSLDDLSRDTSVSFGASTTGDSCSAVAGPAEELQAYDTSAKQRVPSWCDRVLWRSTVPAEEEVAALSAEPEAQGFGSRMSRGISQALLIPQIKQATHRREARRQATAGAGPLVTFAEPYTASPTAEFGSRYSPLTTPNERTQHPAKEVAPPTPSSTRSPFRRLFQRKKHQKRAADTVSLHGDTSSAAPKGKRDAPTRAAMSAVDLPSQLLRRTSTDVVPAAEHRRKSSLMSRASTLLAPLNDRVDSDADADAPPTPTVADDVVGGVPPVNGTSRRAASWWADRVGSRLPSILTPQGAVAALASLGVFGSDAAAAAVAKEKDGDALVGPKKGRVECLLYTTLNDREMRALEGRSDHRPVIFVAAVGI